jgi:RNA polymerase sigma-70 factor (ECF subfamily)
MGTSRDIGPAPTTDAAAIEASLGSPAEFARVFDRHYDRINAYLRRRVGASLADELASETFLVAFEGRRRYDVSRADASPWLYGIATNLARSHQRRQQRQLRAYARVGAVESVDAFDGAEDRVDASRVRPQLVALLSALSPEEADPLLLFAWAGLSHGEIAEALDLPVGTVRSRISRVRARLREQLRLERPTTGNESIAIKELDRG